MPAHSEESPEPLRFLSLEITGTCNLACGHCYATSGPKAGQGAMTEQGWRDVISQAAGLGVERVQFIGGEPVLNSWLPGLIRHALALDLAVSVFTNLTRVSSELWELYRSPRVKVRTSWYSADPAVHARITGNSHSWAATRGSIAVAVALGVRLQVGVVTVEDGQDTAAAVEHLKGLGVTDIRVRPLQVLGRAASDGQDPHDASQLCGRCGAGKAAVLPDGQVTPCELARWLEAGNVRDAPLAAILGGSGWQAALTQVAEGRQRDCQPNGDADNCQPDDETIDPSAALVPAEGGARPPGGGSRGGAPAEHGASVMPVPVPVASR
jgi:MoaA/NifB/PqqE/SkfB family radical SAM enzyme